jgi:hypothetical protein
LRSNSNRNKDAGQISKKIINPLFYLYELPKYHPIKVPRTLEQSIFDLSYFRIHVRDKNKKFG